MSDTSTKRGRKPLSDADKAEQAAELAAWLADQSVESLIDWAAGSVDARRAFRVHKEATRDAADAVASLKALGVELTKEQRKVLGL